jgi:APA family basic amino acid/polyamine antiporter
VKEAGIIQLVTTVLKLIPLFVIGVAAVFYFDKAAFTPLNTSPVSDFDAVTATAALTLWAFLGLESATVPADSVANPTVNIPRATLLGFLIAAVVYILSTMTILSVVPQADLVSSVAPFADAAGLMWGEWAGYFIAAIAVISCFGALNGWTLIQGQMPMAAANDGLFPAIFKANPESGVPVAGLIISSVLVSVLAISNYTGGLVALFTYTILLSTLAVLVPYLFTILYELKLVWQRRRWLAEWLTIASGSLALAYTLWAISGIGQDALLGGLGLMLMGVPVYWWMLRASANKPT